MKNNIKNIVTSYLKPGQVLIDLKENPQGDYIQIVIDSDNNISLKDTADLTKKIRNSSEFESAFPNGSRLEVSTPGPEYSLQHPFQYKKSIDRELKITYDENGDSTAVRGKVIDADDDSVKLKLNDGELSLAYAKIKSATVTFSFE